MRALSLFLTASVSLLSIGCEDFYSQPRNGEGGQKPPMDAKDMSGPPSDGGMVHEDMHIPPGMDGGTPGQWESAYTIDTSTLPFSDADYRLVAFSPSSTPDQGLRVYFKLGVFYISYGAESSSKQLKPIASSTLKGTSIINFLSPEMLLIYDGNIVMPTGGMNSEIDINLFTINSLSDLKINHCLPAQANRIPAAVESKSVSSVVLSSDSKFLIVEYCDMRGTKIACKTVPYSTKAIISSPLVCDGEY